jgi:hypothetical protein
MDPVYFLRQYTGGQAVSKPLVQLIHELKESYSLPNGVINSLFEFCLLENDYKINRFHVLELAEELYERNISTGKETVHYLQNRKLTPPPSSSCSPPDQYEYNTDYIETNIALLARQLHDFRNELKGCVRQMNKQIGRIESRLEQLAKLINKMD